MAQYIHTWSGSEIQMLSCYVRKMRMISISTTIHRLVRTPGFAESNKVENLFGLLLGKWNEISAHLLRDFIPMALK